MIESYISSVSSLYFPLLFSFGGAFLFAAALSPFLGSEKERPKPLGLIFVVTSLLTAWPFVLPILMAGAFSLIIIGGSTIAYEASSKFVESQHYLRIVKRIKALFPTG